MTIGLRQSVPTSSAFLRSRAGMGLSPSDAAVDRGAMDLLIAVLSTAALLPALVLLHSPAAVRAGREALGRARRCAVRYWQAQVHLWEAFLTQAPWGSSDPGGRAAVGDDVQPLHWVGQVLEGSVLPGRRC